jgi:small subunit ribosomal protein S6
MVSYELVVLLPSKEEEEKIKKTITGNKGKIINEDFLGEKSLAYPIKKYSQALYYSYTFSIEENKNVLNLRKELNFNDKIIRYLLLVKD